MKNYSAHLTSADCPLLFEIAPFGRPSAMSAKKVFAWALHIGLMVPALVFVLHAITDFAKGSAGYSEDHQPISFGDLPTLTVCLNTNYKLAYAKDMLIYASVFEIDS